MDWNDCRCLITRTLAKVYFYLQFTLTTQRNTWLSLVVFSFLPHSTYQEVWRAESCGKKSFAYFRSKFLSPSQWNTHAISNVQLIICTLLPSHFTFAFYFALVSVNCLTIMLKWKHCHCFPRILHYICDLDWHTFNNSCNV